MGQSVCRIRKKRTFSKITAFIHFGPAREASEARTPKSSTQPRLVDLLMSRSHQDHDTLQYPFYLYFVLQPATFQLGAACRRPSGEINLNAHSTLLVRFSLYLCIELVLMCFYSACHLSPFISDLVLT